MTTMTVRKQCSLFCREGSSDKEYNIFIEDSATVPGAYDVRATWGRRGSPRDSQYKANGVTMLQAEATLMSLKRSKEAKRYREDPSLAKGTPLTAVPAATIVSNTVAPATPEREYTELKPQLLNPITVDDMEAYITSDEWLAQEKLDGKRIMVEVNFGQVTASNRRSWKVGIPQDVEEELSRFDDCVLDG